MERVAFIGLGVMGNAMARHLMEKGYKLFLYNRTKEKAQNLIEAGAVWCDSIADCVKDAEAVITMVGYPRDVEAVYLASGGILESAKAGCFLIDMTTTDPKLSLCIYEAGKEKGLFCLDAPVSGGDKGAMEGSLSIMVGGEGFAFEACKPLFEAMGQKIVYCGKAGSGQHTKMANQIAIAGTIAGVTEALTYARAVELDPKVMLDAISAGAAGSWQLSNQTPKMLAADYAPGFYVKHFIKDMQIASDVAISLDEPLPVLDTVLDMYKELENQGGGDLGTQALIRFYED